MILLSKRYIGIFLTVSLFCASNAIATSAVELRAERHRGYHPEYGYFYQNTQTLSDSQLGLAEPIFKMTRNLSKALLAITKATGPLEETETKEGCSCFGSGSALADFVSHDPVALANNLRDAILALPEIEPTPTILSFYCFCEPIKAVLYKVQLEGLLAKIDVRLQRALMQLHYVACYRYIQMSPRAAVQLWTDLEEGDETLQIGLDTGFENMRAGGILIVNPEQFMTETSLALDPAAYFKYWHALPFSWADWRL